MEGAVLCADNYSPLTPISFLERSALVYPDRPAVVSAAGDAPPRTWRETRDRCLRLAATLAGLDVQRHDVVRIRYPHATPLQSKIQLLICSSFGQLTLSLTSSRNSCRS